MSVYPSISQFISYDEKGVWLWCRCSIRKNISLFQLSIEMVSARWLFTYLKIKSQLGSKQTPSRLSSKKKLSYPTQISTRHPIKAFIWKEQSCSMTSYQFDVRKICHRMKVNTCVEQHQRDRKCSTAIGKWSIPAIITKMFLYSLLMICPLKLRSCCLITPTHTLSSHWKVD